MLAGQELHFTVEVVATREATLEEIAHGHVHGAHSHHHDDDERRSRLWLWWSSPPSRP